MFLWERRGLVVALVVVVVVMLCFGVSPKFKL
jgi:hypothetical protein